MISLLSTVPQLLDPFCANHVSIAGSPVLAAFASLLLLCDRDTLWRLKRPSE